VRSVKRLGKLIGFAILLLLTFGAGYLYPILNRPPIVLHQDAAFPGVSRGGVRVRWRNEGGGFIDVAPVSGADTLLIFYPGGLVRPQAYEWLGVALAPRGVRTVIPAFPFDLAVVGPNRAAALLEALAVDPATRVVLGGHSLGGAMAARFAARQPDALDALVLMGAFSAEGDDLSAAPFDALVLAAEYDGLATLEEVRAGLERLPASTELVIIEGAVHSFFGRYGPQRGDGRPTVTRETAEARIVAALEGFLAR
jgi:pimeloyl-ACP methyl ester carboxylesterase